MYKKVSEYKDITQHEIHALKTDLNLADAHTHQSQSKTQKKNIIKRLPKIWYEAEDALQSEMEEKFLYEFSRVAKQEDMLVGHPPLLVYASSIAMVMVANYLKKQNLTVALMEPCFDNIHDILKHMEVPMTPLYEEWLDDPNTLYDNLVKNITADALFIIDPNNPTGKSLFSHGEKAYAELIRYAKDHDKILLFDYCFAAFVDHAISIEVPPVYKMFNESGVKYIAIEDTGKTWPLQDTKVAMLKICESLYEDVYNIHTAYLLNVSPFILNLVTQYVLDSEKDNFDSVYGLLGRNREIIKKELSGTLLEYIEPDTNVSVAWFKVKDPKITSTELQEFILEFSNVYVLSGKYFYWDREEEKEKYIRVALARNTDVFKKAVQGLKEALNSFSKK